MSQNLDLVRSIYADWELGDWGSATWAHDDIAYVMVDEPGSHVYVGLAEMARAWRSFLSARTDYRFEPVEYRSLDRERVRVIIRAHGRGKSSGVELDESTSHRGATLFHIRDGRVAWRRASWTRIYAAITRSLGRSVECSGVGPVTLRYHSVEPQAVHRGRR